MFPVATARPWKFRWVATTYGLLTKHDFKMAGYYLSYVFWVFMDQDGVEVHKHAKNKEWDKYPAMTGRAWLIKDLSWKRTLFSCGTKQVIPSRLLFPQYPRTVGYGPRVTSYRYHWSVLLPAGAPLPVSLSPPGLWNMAHPWRQVWNFNSRVAALGTTWFVLLSGGALLFPSAPPGLWNMGLMPWGRSGTLIPGWLPLVPLDLYSSQEGASLLFSSVSGTVNRGLMPGGRLKLLFQGGYPWHHLICTSLGGAPPPGSHLCSLASVPVKLFSPTTSVSLKSNSDNLKTGS